MPEAVRMEKNIYARRTRDNSPISIAETPIDPITPVNDEVLPIISQYDQESPRPRRSGRIRPGKDIHIISQEANAITESPHPFDLQHGCNGVVYPVTGETRTKYQKLDKNSHRL